MHEYHFSLKGKYKNTHFALIEEQDILTNITLHLAPTHTLLTFLSLTTRFALTVTVLEMLIGTC
jgi:hypothetical protein